MKKNSIAFFCGTLFALGLGISQMTRPPVILAFLNLAGTWDPTLAYVFATAVSLFSLGYWFFFDKSVRDPFEKGLRPKEKLKFRVILGAIVFGIGWGLVGLCPGPAITNLASFKGEVFLFVIALVIGMEGVKFGRKIF